jgi:hypothetical protein
MDKVNINLLPTEVSLEQQKQAKFSKVQTISIGILLFFILLASVSVAIRIFQSQTLNKLDDEVKSLEATVEESRAKEESLVILKNRITAISQLISGSHAPTEMFNLVYGQIPVNVSITGITVDRIGNVFLSLVIPDSNSLEEMINVFSTKEAFESIKKIDLENLSTGSDGQFRLNMKVYSNI